jgi:hypothetical protein
MRDVEQRLKLDEHYERIADFMSHFGDESLGEKIRFYPTEPARFELEPPT